MNANLSESCNITTTKTELVKIIIYILKNAAGLIRIIRNITTYSDTILAKLPASSL